jgi:bifunctional non-homologous end joining protein LigD
VVGLYKDGELIHIGEVGGGFSTRTLASVYAQLKPLVQARCPFQAKPKTNEPATWVRPELVCEVRFTAWTGGHLRHPIFVGMRGGEEWDPAPYACVIGAALTHPRRAIQAVA